MHELATAGFLISGTSAVMASAHFDFNSNVGDSIRAPNLYEVLGVGPNASKEEIRRSFLDKARHAHPDKNSGLPQSEKMMKLLNEARDILCDPDKRIEYDEQLANDDDLSTPIATDLM